MGFESKTSKVGGNTIAREDFCLNNSLRLNVRCEFSCFIGEYSLIMAEESALNNSILTVNMFLYSKAIPLALTTVRLVGGESTPMISLHFPEFRSLEIVTVWYPEIEIES